MSVFNNFLLFFPFNAAPLEEAKMYNKCMYLWSRSGDAHIYNGETEKKTREKQEK